MASSWSATGDFFGAILAGLLLGLLGDRLLGTDPWLVVIGVIAGFGIGFWRMMQYSEKIEDEAAKLERTDLPPPPDGWDEGPGWDGTDGWG